MNHLGFTSSHADLDVWTWRAKRTSGEEYNKYVLLYVDDVLAISKRAEQVLQKEIGQEFVLKDESIGKPTQYLGGKLCGVTLENRVSAWSFCSTQMYKLWSRMWKSTCCRKGRSWLQKL
jgi:hypothetical protein